ncbi:CYTH domain-containing protein [Scopulibacillus cellulosilyticus]|uniref:CYTH domain-containing protein n=1 Tax=Scopulibacillus cellulosilyticus TaxID=2665665 RepID=A0ABW2Q0K6_9BACL
MNQEIEIEFKNILTKTEFEQLRDHFQLDNVFLRQVNHYFDTQKFDLKSKGAALRIREKNKKQVLTLKQPHQEGLLETHQYLSHSEANNMIETGQLPKGDIQNILTHSGIKETKLQYLGSLTTDRAQISFKNGELVLDHSYYFDKDDYELEYEATDAKSGKEIFNQLLSQFHIPSRETKNKIRRFFETKKSMEDTK